MDNSKLYITILYAAMIGFTVLVAISSIAVICLLKYTSDGFQELPGLFAIIAGIQAWVSLLSATVVAIWAGNIANAKDLEICLASQFFSGLSAFLFLLIACCII